jgi:hypothetical protein
MNKNTSPEVLNSCSGNLKSKIENLKLKWFRRTFWRERIELSSDFGF